MYAAAYDHRSAYPSNHEQNAPQMASVPISGSGFVQPFTLQRDNLETIIYNDGERVINNNNDDEYLFESSIN